MKKQQDLPGGTGSTRAAFVSRWLFSGAFLGLLIGLAEATRLWTTPRVIPLLVPDVGWVIWFLAPLVDMIFFGLAGLALGWLASRTAHKEVFVAAYAALAFTFIYLMVKWFHVEIGLHPFNFTVEFLVPLMVFAAAFVVLLVLLAVVWRQLAGLWERWIARLIKPLGWGLAAAAVVSIAAIAVFAIWPPTSGPAGPATAAPPPGAPNIVFIVMDTVRADHLSSYGYSRPTTPNIDRFARSGVLFENAIAASSWTLASHASMFTGLLPQQHGANWAVPLAANPWTLAEVLRSQGYRTAGFVANQLYLQRGWGIAQGFEQYVGNRVSLRDNLSETLLGDVVIQAFYRNFDRFDYFGRESAGQLNQRVLRWLHRGSRRPYFLFINYFDAHNPYFAPAPYGRRFGQLSSALASRLFDFSSTGDLSAHFSPQERDSLIAGYDNCLAYLDGQLGALLGSLRQSPQWDNTVIIITSDHGEDFGWHGSYEHGRNLFRGVLHVPLIIAGPGIPKDMRVSHVAGTRQLFSTVLDLAGHGHTPFTRTSLARFWGPNFKPGPSDDAVVSELIPWPDPHARRAAVSLTTSDRQYIIHRDGRQELYNWTTDPEEKDNLAASSAEQATLAGLRSRLVSLVSDATGPWQGMAYLSALEGVAGGPGRVSLLRPRPLLLESASNSFRIGMSQAFFKPDNSEPVGPTQSDRDLMRSLPYQ